ncbi:DUF2490 domain-containing protein [Fulvivirgaceae bacterium BMA10]|uniref:DUF2490 domain-containing protein n=1 Tax=Splendidivirga corallicola TaxID=3051826 RepID=A0ABT8KMH5_9BACT|nr:DUF2490 domain-containing protein [Fulvivirgaceae bacterium BMA10]
MKKLLIIVAIAVFNLLPQKLFSQIDEDQLGAWYMYFWNTSIKESAWGFQGDIQYRNWDLIGDLEQLLLRGGLTYQPNNTPVKFTLGYGYVSTGEFGSGTNTVTESRIYQEALIPQKLGGRFYVTHRFRFEQRFVESQDFRTRWRYNVFLNVPLNKKDLQPGAVYIAFYNELFINGQRNIGDGRMVELFDRNRTYGALGYSVKEGLRVQFGLMRQKTNSWSKKQLQLSLHHKF